MEGPGSRNTKKGTDNDMDRTSDDPKGTPEAGTPERPVTNEDQQRQITNTPPPGDTGLSEEQVEGG